VASTDEQYLQLLKVPLLRGRFFTSRDVGQPRVAVINEALASRLGGGDVIGRRILIEREWRDIVGVVADVTEIGQLRAGLIRQAGLARLTLPAAYVPRGARTTDSLFLLCRPGLDATGATELLRTHVRAVDPEATIRRSGWLEDRVRSAGADVRFCALLVAMFSAGGLMLAAIGLYGVVSHGVSQRTTEIGVRTALGATPGRVQWMLIGELVGLVVVGALVGLGATLGAGSVLRAFLFEVPANDPGTLAAAAVGLLAVAALAAYLPARRAGHLDPVQALRSE